MKGKLILPILFGCLLSLASAHSAFALSELGKNPFYSNYIESEEEMVQMLLANSDDIEKGLTKAGMPELYEPMMAQLPEAEVERVQFHPGDTFPWMFYRKDGRGPVRIDKDVVWEGEEPFNSYSFHIDYNDRRHTFTVPPVCGNLTYVGAGPVPPPPAPVEKEEEPAAAAPPPPPEEMEETVVEEAARFPFLFDAGYLHQPDPADHLLLRVGMEFPINDTFSIIGMIGAAPKISGDDSDDAFVADIFANYSRSRFFFGLGVGAWITGGDDDLDHEDDDFDLIINAGTRIFGEEDGFNTSLFIEARTDFDELEDFDHYGKFGVGLRFRF